ncbi:COX15/CtaA family protein [Pseudonocardia xinjiangensis]|uniref:COX15/CtaA family protein n=1 Tax=Pseudonocardia xinjiangensis TaxID=75289 RepID=UPI003D9356BC
MTSDDAGAPSGAEAALRRFAGANVVAHVVITVTGAFVRVTGSGLGCPTWPQCDPGSLVPTPREDIAPVIQWIEFGNRLLGTVVLLISVGCLVAAWRLRPRRRRVVSLAAIMPAGAVLQGVIGGFTVLNQLAWWNVMLHFLPSMLLIWFAVQLVVAVFLPDDPQRVALSPPGRAVATAGVVTLGLLLTAGTLVTAAGPHAGDPATPRLDLPVQALAGLHSVLLVLYLVLLAALGVVLRLSSAPPRARRRFVLLVAVVAAQGALGSVQYAVGVPEVLVLLHVLGAAAVVAAASLLWASIAVPVGQDADGGQTDSGTSAAWSVRGVPARNGPTSSRRRTNISGSRKAV